MVNAAQVIASARGNDGSSGRGTGRMAWPGLSGGAPPSSRDQSAPLVSINRSTVPASFSRALPDETFSKFECHWRGKIVHHGRPETASCPTGVSSQRYRFGELRK